MGDAYVHNNPLRYLDPMGTTTTTKTIEEMNAQVELGQEREQAWDDFSSGFEKGTEDLIDGLVSAPKAMISYGDHIGRISGFRDYQEGNILPANKWEAELEYSAIKYGLTNHKSEILNSLVEDIKDRPNYYIGGLIVGPMVGSVSSLAGASVSATTVIKIPGAASDYIHTEVNPLHKEE